MSWDWGESVNTAGGVWMLSEQIQRSPGRLLGRLFPSMDANSLCIGALRRRRSGVQLALIGGWPVREIAFRLAVGGRFGYWVGNMRLALSKFIFQ